MNINIKTIALLVASICVLSSVSAAEESPNADSPSNKDDRFNAQMEPFLTALNLTDEQKPKFLAIQKAMTTKWAELQKLPADEWKPKQQAFYKDRHEQLEQLLTPEQMAKYLAIRARRTAGTNATVEEKRHPNITLTRIDGQYWLVGPNGKPFFAHGITHVSNNRAKFDFAAISVACKKLGFNSYGYGCPEQLKHDMPYVESWNHLVPISYYRGKNGVKFVDVFDPKEQTRLDAGVQANCYRSVNHMHNVIGYCWTDLGSWPLDNPSGRNWVDFIRGLSTASLSQYAFAESMKTTQPEPDGFFTPGKRKDHWWLITPDGKPFFSMGLNHIDPASLRYPENLDLWREKYGGSTTALWTNGKDTRAGKLNESELIKDVKIRAVKATEVGN